MTEQTERLERRDTRKVFRAVRKSTASLSYEDKDIEDAASILSEDPSVTLAVDPIILRSKVYQKYHPERYRRMMHHFPSRADSVSTLGPRKAFSHARTKSRDNDPMIGQNMNLPFLGIPFQGETPSVQESETETESEDDGTVHEGAVEQDLQKEAVTLPSGPTEVGELRDKQVSEHDFQGLALHNTKRSGSEDFKYISEDVPHVQSPKVERLIGSRQPTVAERDLSSYPERKPPPVDVPDPPESFPHIPPKQASSQSSVHSFHASDVSDLYNEGDEITRPEQPAATSSQLETERPPLRLQSSGDYADLEKVVTSPTLEEPKPMLLYATSMDKSNLQMDAKRRDTKSIPGPGSQDDPAVLVNSTRNFPSLDIDFGPSPFLGITSDASASGHKTSNDNQHCGVKAEVRGSSVAKSVPNVTTEKGLSSSLDGKVKATSDATSNERQDTKEFPAKSSPKIHVSPEDSQNEAPQDPIPVTGSAVLSSGKGRPVSEQSSGTNRSPTVGKRRVSTSSMPVTSQVGNASKGFLQPTSVPSRASTLKAPKRPPPAIPPSPKRTPPPVPQMTSTSLENTVAVPKKSEIESPLSPLEFASGLARSKLPSIPYRHSPVLRSTQERGTVNNVSQDSEPGAQSPTAAQGQFRPPKSPIEAQPSSTFDDILGPDTQMPNPAPSPLKPSGSPSMRSEMEESVASSATSSLQDYGTQVTKSIFASENTAPTEQSLYGKPPPMSATWSPDPKKFNISQSLEIIGEKNKADRSLTKLSKFSSIMGLKPSSKVIRVAESTEIGELASLRAALKALDKSSDVQIAVCLGAEKVARTALMRAASRGYIAVMEELSAYDIDCSTADKTGRTAMHHALEASKPEAAEWLLYFQRGLSRTKPWIARGITDADLVMIRDKEGHTPIHLAAAREHVEVLEAFINAGADVCVRDSQGRTPLHHAVQRQMLISAKFLVSKMTNVDEVDRNGETPLMLAAKTNGLDLVTCLLESGADKSQKDNNGDHAIHHAARHGRLAVLEILFIGLEDLEAKNNRGERPIHLACAANHSRVVRALARAGCQINPFTEPPHSKLNIKSTRENMAEVSMSLASTPLHYACACGLYDIADVLLNHGAMVNAHQEDGTSPLMLACNSESPGLTQLLLQKGANPNSATSKERMTALHISARRNGLETTKLLVDYGADIKAKLQSKPYHTPAGYAMDENPFGKRDAANYLLAISFRGISRSYARTANPGQRSVNPGFAPGPALGPHGTSYAAPYTTSSGGHAYGHENLGAESARTTGTDIGGYFTPSATTAVAPPSYAESQAEARGNARDQSKLT